MDYERWWEDYDEINRQDPGTRIRKKIIVNAVKASKYKKVLDAGCGSGELLEYLHSKFPEKELYGTDISKKALEILERKKVTQESFISNLEKDRKLKGIYDVIICSEIIEHLKNWKSAISILARSVSKNSIVIITTQSGKRYPHHLAIGHIQHFELEEITNELKKAGLTIVIAKRIGWPFMNAKNLLASIFIKNDSSLLKNNKITILQKIAFNIFYYLYLLSPFPGPQIIIIAEQKYKLRPIDYNKKP